MRNAGAPSAIVVSGACTFGSTSRTPSDGCVIRWSPVGLMKQVAVWVVKNPKNGCFDVVWCGLNTQETVAAFVHSRFTCADPHGFGVFIKHQSHCRTLSLLGGVCSTCCWNTFASCDDKRNKYTVRFSPKRKEPAVDNRLMQSLRIHCGQYLRYLEIMGTQWYRPFGVRFLGGRW